MVVDTTRNFKYTFMIIPFKFKGEINNEKIESTSFFKPCDREKIHYDRLYKHVADSISATNPDRTIFDYWVNRELAWPSLFRKPLTFNVSLTKNKYTAEGFLKDIFAYCFKNGIGFIVLNFVFDENLEFDVACEILNKLKKVRRTSDDSKFEILLGHDPIDLFSIINEIPKSLGIDYDLFFEHSNKEYVSAIMLNSFTYFEPLSNEDIQKLEDTLYDKLGSLKRSQGKSYGTHEDVNAKYIRPFKNMAWAFSAQGIANINYNDPNIGNINFLEDFYKNIKREYLLMTLIVLNQEFMLLDYCQKFTTSINEIPSIEELNRLYNFKIHSTFTTISHLEHYRAFYNLYSEELGISHILEEVNVKQNAVYLSNKNKIAEEKSRREKNVNRFTKVLSVILSIFGITGLINNVASLIARDNAWKISLIVISTVALAVGIVMGISKWREDSFKKRTTYKKTDHDKHEE